jgi:sugar lactone lactonase YvrE
MMETAAISRVDCRNLLGEGPFWDERNATLYWVDIQAARLYSLIPESNQLDFLQLPMAATALGARASGGLIAASRVGLAAIDPLERAFTRLVDVLDDSPDLRFNDGAVDPLGRFFAGTYSGAHQPVSRLFRFDPDQSVTVIQEGLVNSNGIDWSPDHRTMYHTHTTERTIYAYDFDPATGEMTNRHAFIQVPDAEGEGVPDGLTVDRDGFLWSARYYAGKVVRYDPDGQVEREIRVPAQNVTSCVFGGPNRSTLFITTARTQPKEPPRPDEQDGNLFVLETDTAGQPVTAFRG